MNHDDIRRCHQPHRRSISQVNVLKLTMVLKLREQLIKHVAIHLSILPSYLCQCLTTDQRERILRWLVSHDRLSYSILPYITKNLLAVPLHSLEFYKCSQLTNDMLIAFSQASNLGRLKSLIIHQCVHINGKALMFYIVLINFRVNRLIDTGLLAITKGQISLEYVALRKLHGLTDKGLANIHSAFLKEIDLRFNDDIHDQGITSSFKISSWTCNQFI
jgi:hypothetical protein